MIVPESAIGSVLPLEHVDHRPCPDSVWNAWTSGQPHVAAYASARAALATLLEFRGIRRLWLPAYACEALAAAGRSCDLLWYGVDLRLDPDLVLLAEEVRAGDAVLLIAFFGRPPCAAVRTLAAKRPDVLWIEDRAQCIEPPASAWSDVVLYSPRKVIGVGEGGVMVGTGPLPVPSRPARPGSSQAQQERRRDLQGLHPERWFPVFQAQEAAMEPDAAAMSPETFAILTRVPLAPLTAARRRNSALLVAALPDLILRPCRSGDSAPLAVPIRIARRDAVAAVLAARRIFCACHWARLPSDPAMFSIAGRLSTQMLSLPCGHDCTPSDIRRIVQALRDAGAERAAD